MAAIDVPAHADGKQVWHARARTTGERSEGCNERFIVGAKHDGVGLVAFEAQRGAGFNQRQ